MLVLGVMVVSLAGCARNRAAVQAAPPPEIPPDKSTWLGRSTLEWLRDTIYDSTMHSPWRPDDYGQPVSYSP
jgi:hypothetical protein